jgi:hypothetical protein
MVRALEGGWSLLPITGLLPGHNLFGDDQGDWEAGCVPAPVGNALFDEVGAQVAWLGVRLRAPVGTAASLAETSLQIQALQEAGLLHASTLQTLLADGCDIELNGFTAANESLLAKLPVDKLHALHSSGALTLAYLHLLSMRRFSRTGLAGQPAPVVLTAAGVQTTLLEPA